MSINVKNEDRSLQFEQGYFRFHGEIIGRKKEDVIKAIAELQREKKLPYLGYKPNIRGILYVYYSETFEKRRLYDPEFYLGQDEELDNILKDIIRADYRKVKYSLDYPWELLKSLRPKHDKGVKQK